MGMVVKTTVFDPFVGVVFEIVCEWFWVTYFG